MSSQETVQALNNNENELLISYQFISYASVHGIAATVSLFDNEERKRRKTKNQRVVITFSNLEQQEGGAIER